MTLSDLMRQAIDGHDEAEVAGRMEATVRDLRRWVSGGRVISPDRLDDFFRALALDEVTRARMIAARADAARGGVA